MKKRIIIIFIFICIILTSNLIHNLLINKIINDHEEKTYTQSTKVKE